MTLATATPSSVGQLKRLTEGGNSDNIVAPEPVQQTVLCQVHFRVHQESGSSASPLSLAHRSRGCGDGFFGYSCLYRWQLAEDVKDGT